MGWWYVRYACPARSMVSLWQRQAKRNLKNKRVVGIIVNLRLQSCTSQHERTFSNCWHICIRDVSMQYRKNCLQQTLHTLCWYRACCFRSIIQRNMQRKFVPCIRNWAHHCKSSPHKKLFIADNHSWSSSCLLMSGLWAKIQEYNIALFRIIHYHTSFPAGEPQSNPSAIYSVSLSPVNFPISELLPA